MLLIIGLGNPGDKYLKTRHNAGFIVLDELQKKWKLPEFSENSKFNALISEGQISINSDNNTKIILVKPLTFMNNSGLAVQKVLQFYKPARNASDSVAGGVNINNLIVIHDDLDLEIGKMKLYNGDSSLGHKGIEDIVNKTGLYSFQRLRIGVEKKGGRSQRGNISGEKFVLQNLDKSEFEDIFKLVPEISLRITN